MHALRSIAPWLPWITPLIVTGWDGTARFGLGLVIGLVTVVALALAGLDRGLLMWVTLAFFAVMTIAVVGLHSRWTIGHFAALANTTLAAAAWWSLLVGKPFTLEAARSQTDPSHWDHPTFLRANVLITAAWATAFTINAAISWAAMHDRLPTWVVYSVSSVTLLGAVLFSDWYPKRLRRAAETNDAR